MWGRSESTAERHSVPAAESSAERLRSHARSLDRSAPKGISSDRSTQAALKRCADGTSPPSAPSGAINVGVAPTIVSGPADGTAGKPCSSGFQVTGAPAPALTLVSGTLPPGLAPLASDGTLTGTPTQAGTYTFTVQAANPVGIAEDTVTVTISPASSG